MRGMREHVVVVTGSARGIGKAIAMRLAAEGAAVVVNSQSEGGAESLARDLRNQGHRAIGVSGDVSEPTDVDRIFAVCRGEFGECSLLVNNAGFERRVAFDAMTLDDWDRMIAVHLRGTFLCCRAAIGGMLGMGEGVIVNIVSRQGQTGGIEIAHYAAAKAGIVGLTKSLAREFSRRGIRVNAVAPGPINTDMADGFVGDWRRKRMADLPLGIFGEPEDVAETVMFLASSSGRLYVGQTLCPNSGGLMLG